MDVDESVESALEKPSRLCFVGSHFYFLWHFLLSMRGTTSQTPRVLIPWIRRHLFPVMDSA